MAEPTTPVADLTLQRAIDLVDTDEVRDLLIKLGDRVAAVRPEMDRFRQWCDRADQLYYAETFTRGGADLWADHESATAPGRTHVSINTPPVYVDVPAAMQSVEPIENMLATDTTKEARDAAADMERVYTAWKQAEDYELKFHKACTIKGLYGRTASKVYWDRDPDQNEEARPCVEVVEQPRNLYLGYRSDEYNEVEWAAYVVRMDPNTVIEEFDVDVTARAWEDNSIIPYVQSYTMNARPSRSWLQFGSARVEVWDYWYRQPKYGKNGKLIKMETWNVIIAGNAVVQKPTMYPEYKGKIPYLPLHNTFIPGLPMGRPELYDIEPLIREKFERVTAGAQMIASAVAGDYWQLTGVEAPSRIDPGLKPERNKIVAPGAGNRIETITPFIAQFQLEQYLGRLDREMGEVSGLNDLLLGLAPSQVLSSSKAINALISNYESRLSMRRGLLYQWRRANWEMVLGIWAAKDTRIAGIVKNGSGYLDIVDPSLSPRDEMETAQRVIALMNAKVWSQRRAMDATGVDDPETEQDLIREERTDATLFPADVQVMAQLLQALQALGLPQPPSAVGQADKQLARGQNDLRTALGSPSGGASSQLPGDIGATQPEAQVPGATPPAPTVSSPFAQGAPTPQPGGQFGPLGEAQTIIQGGRPKSTIMTRSPLGRR